MTIAASRAGRAVRKVSLARSRVVPAANGKATHAFKLSARLRTQIRAAFARAQPRNRVSVLVTATAVDAAGNRTAKGLRIRLRP